MTNILTITLRGWYRLMRLITDNRTELNNRLASFMGRGKGSGSCWTWEQTTLWPKIITITTITTVFINIMTNLPVVEERRSVRIDSVSTAKKASLPQLCYIVWLPGGHKKYTLLLGQMNLAIWTYTFAIWTNAFAIWTNRDKQCLCSQATLLASILLYSVAAWG